MKILGMRNNSKAEFEVEFEDWMLKSKFLINRYYSTNAALVSTVMLSS